jgi:hypothetical protein
MNKEDVNPEVRESLRNQSDRTAKFAEQDLKMVEYLIHILQKHIIQKEQ